MRFCVRFIPNRKKKRRRGERSGCTEQVRRHRGRAVVLFAGGDMVLIRADEAGQLDWGKAAGKE